MQTIQTCRAAVLLLTFLLGHSSATFAGSDETVIRFLHYNDLHAHLTGHLDLVADGTGDRATTRVVEKGGLARTATLIKQQRAENPNNVLMNIGDTFHGGVEALFTQGNAIVAPVNALGIDVGVPGNWDYAYGPHITRARFLAEEDKFFLFRNSEDGEPRWRDSLKQYLREGGSKSQLMADMMMAGTDKPNYPNLAANVTIKDDGEPFLAPTLMKEVAGVRIGFVGLSSDMVPKMHKSLAIGLNFLQGESAYVELINRYRKKLETAGADIVVVMSELGIQKDYRLAQLVESGIAVFFSAHTHEATFEALNSKSGALVVEAGNDGYLGRMDITLRAGKIINRDWTLLPVDNSIAEDPEMKILVEKARAPFLSKDIDLYTGGLKARQHLNQPIDTVIGHTHTTLSRYASLENDFNNLFTDWSRGLTGTELAVSPGFRFGHPLISSELEDPPVNAGEITLEDAYRYFPVSYGLSTALISGENLNKIIEDLLTEVYSTDVFNQAGGWVSGFSGLRVELDLTRPDGQRVLAMYRTDSGKKISDKDVLTITGCSRPFDEDGVLCSAPGYTGVSPVKNIKTGNIWTVVDLFIEGLNRYRIPKNIRRDFEDKSDSAIWPKRPFIQPLQGIGKVEN
jgi:2',3'-cyclic-nucleotide 2'-phosphodiesterase (5'-nucleotidase family)